MIDPQHVPKGLALWWLAVRPKTLAMAVNPVLLATALAWSEGRGVAPFATTFTILICAVAIQAGTNLLNDAQDHLNGTDHGQRHGPARISAMGWAPPRKVILAGLIAFAVALIGGLHLVSLGGWPILLLGFASLMAGYFYSHGPYPISRSPYGELLVIGFFGVGALGGTYYLHTGSLSITSLIWGLVMGMPAAAVLLLNNLRDRISDERAGRRTLALVLGSIQTRRLYGLLLFIPYGLMGLLVVLGLAPVGILLGLISFALAIAILRAISNNEPSPLFNALLARTVQLQTVMTLLCGLGLIIGDLNS